MLVIQPAADGRLRISNSRRSEIARDVASARTLAYAWGHTDVSINKALAEMRAGGATEAPSSGWRIARPAPVAERSAAPAAAPPPRKRTPRREPKPAAERAPETPPAIAKTARKPREKKASATPPPPKKAGVEKKAAVKRPAKPAPAIDPRARALSLFLAGARELAALERDTLPFARAPWSELRQMAEHIAGCLQGKKGK